MSLFFLRLFFWLLFPQHYVNMLALSVVWPLSNSILEMLRKNGTKYVLSSFLIVNPAVDGALSWILQILAVLFFPLPLPFTD